MKKDLEYNMGQEFELPPDEYLQGGGNEVPEGRKRKAVWKKMIYMVASFSVVAYVAVSSSDSMIPAHIGTDNKVTDKEPQGISDKQDAAEVPETEAPDGQKENASLPSLKIYPIEDGTSFYVVNNETYDMNSETGYRILGQGFIFESLLLQGMDYQLPKHEPSEGYEFLGWVIYYDGGNYGMAGNALTAENVCYVKPENGSRSIEVHAAWRRDGIGQHPYLLTLDANGGTIEGESTATYDAAGPMESGTNIYLCAYPVPEREGYTFAGWYANPDSSGKQTNKLFGLDFYEKNGDAYNWSKTIPITLYAGWVKN